MQKKLAFVGCRPERLPFGEDERTASAIRLKALLLNEIMQRVEEGYDTFLTGAMRGGDILFAEQLLLVKALTYPHIRLITVVSYKGQADGWSEMWRERYNRILDYSEEVITRRNAITAIVTMLETGTWWIRQTFFWRFIPEEWPEKRRM